MPYEEKRTWVYLVACTAAYAVYVAIVVAQAQNTPLVQVPYVAPLLWTTMGSIVASMVGRMAIETARPRQTRQSDVRDREISRFGEYVSRWCIVGGAAAGFLMALAQWDYFWIANVIYLGFVSWAVAGSAVKLVAYRRGLSAV